jgi:hypothetical protein
MKQNETNLGPKSSKIFKCELCDYSSSKKSQYIRHLSTDKHKSRTFETNETNMKQESSKKVQCICGKYFKSRTTLWRHKNICNTDIINDNNDDNIEEIHSGSLSDKEIISMLVSQNSELMGLIKNGINNTTTNTINNTNNSNNSFNLNFFLNETCKDAMNISDFVSSIKVSLDDLENTGRRGYIEGISDIILKNLNNLEQQLRPVHCSDSKREVLYIKDNNQWIKENEDKPILKKAVKMIANENIKQIKNWREKYPDCTYADSKKNNLYLKIVSNSMNGLTEEESYKNLNKIISNVAKEVTIDKK